MGIFDHFCLIFLFEAKILRIFYASIDCATIIKNIHPVAPFRRLIFIVIDAFRADFLFESEKMKFLRDFIETGSAIAYSANCQPPTVTMPRIKVKFFMTHVKFFMVKYHV